MEEDIKNNEFIYYNDEWNPGFYNKDNDFIPYEKRWYCNENKIIHGSLKEKENCKYCKYDKKHNENI